MDKENSHTKSWFDRLIDLLLPEPRDREQLMEVLKDAQDRRILDTGALRMIEGVVNVSEFQAKDIMIPRSHMVTIQQPISPDEILPILIESHHSRFPVLEEDSDNVLGILLAKDLLRYGFGRKINFDIKHVLRPAMFIPESKRLDILLREFRQKHNHMAIVIDEYGSIAGLVTMEDVLEQIVGNIEDEYDVESEKENIKQERDGKFSIKALTTIEEFNEYFKANLDTDELDTIGGLVLKACGHLPEVGEKIQLDKFEFEVVQADNRRVHLFRVRQEID